MTSRPPLVLCVGDLDLDMMVAAPHAPGPDEKVHGRRLSVGPGDMMANAAVAMARLGMPARLVAAVGDDREGEIALAAVGAEGVDARFVARRTGAATFLCFVMVLPGGEKALVRVASPAYLPSPADLTPPALEGVGHVHMTFGDPALTLAALDAAQAAGASTSLDLEAADAGQDRAALMAALARVDILFMSARSAEAAAAALGSPARGRAITVETQGAAGARGWGPDGVASVAGVAVETVDTTGAGDAFAAGFLCACLTGPGLGEALAFGNATAALSTTGIGAQTALPRRDAVEALLAKRRRPAHA